MATSISNGNRAVSTKGNTIALPFAAEGPDFAELQQRMTQALQTSLELKAILEKFFNLLQELVPIQGLLYEHRAQHCKMLIGRETTHSVNYRMSTNSDDLGEVTFCRSKRFTEVELASIEFIVSTLVYPLRNALQYREAVQTALRDPLTGAGNRVALNNALEREIQLAERHQQPLSLLVIDIDHFKKINDNFGHATGDQILKATVNCIENLIRQTDLTFRFGGEEFVLVLNRTDLTGARIIAERIRESIASSPLRDGEDPIFATVSIGCSILKPCEDSHGLFGRADKALYAAKENGRNRVEVAP